LQDEDVGIELDRLWQDLARFVSREGSDGGGGTAGGDSGFVATGFAKAVMERLESPEARAAIAGAFERLGRMAQTLEGDRRRAADMKLGDLLATLPREALGLLVDVDLHRDDAMSRLSPATEWLPATVLVDLVDEAARAQGQKLSTFLLRLLRKLAGQATFAERSRAPSEADLRATVRALLADWSLEDPNPRSHTRILDTLATHDLPNEGAGATGAEALRLVEIALETEAFGEQVLEALELALDAGETRQLCGLLASAPPGQVAELMWVELATPALLRRVFRDEKLDAESLGRILSHADESAAPILLSALVPIEDPDLRRLLLGRLLELGPGPAADVLRRVDSGTATERITLLGLLAELPKLPAGFSARRYTDAPEVLVRREAYRIMLRNPDERDEAIHAALADDDRVAELAVEAGLERLPRQALTRLMVFLGNGARSQALRARAVRILSQFDTPSIREWLVASLVTRRGWFRRKRLEVKGALMLAKLRILVDRWPGHAETQSVVALALKSGDPELTAALRGFERT